MTDSGSWSGCSWEAMYSAFPVERCDSLAWDNKMAFWMAAIRRLCLTRKTAVFNLPQLPLDFQRRGRVPKCLDTVVQQMVSLRLARRLSFFVEELDPDGSSWTVWDFLQKPIAFTFNWIVRQPTNWVVNKLFSATKSNESNNNDNNGIVADDELYVMVELVKTFAEGIEELHRKHVSSMPSAENLISYGALMQMSRDIVDDETSFRLALLHLSEQKRCSITTGDDGQKVVRLVESGDNSVQPSTLELKLFRLKAVAEKLEASIDNIAQLMARYKESAKDSYNRGNRNEALRYLKRKKELEHSVISKEQTLDHILALITALKETEFQKQTMDAYRSGIETFKTMKEGFGLSVEEIDKTTLNMQEVFDDSNELQRTMSVGLNSPVISASEDDLEKELNDLLDIPVPLPRQMNASPDAKVGAGGQPELPSSRFASGAGHPHFILPSAQRTNIVNKTSTQYPAVSSNDPLELNSVDRRQEATKPVTMSFGKDARKSLLDEFNEAKSRYNDKSRQSPPLGVAKKCLAE